MLSHGATEATTTTTPQEEEERDRERERSRPSWLSYQTRHFQ